MTSPASSAPTPVEKVSRRSGRLDSLTGLRFFAALIVVLLHATANRANPAGLVDLGPIAGRVTELGYVGVTFFFVLSGFVLTWSANARPVDAWAFYRRRFARVYPLHLAATLVVGAAILAGGGAVGVDVWAACLGLVQAWVPTSSVYFGLNGVSWSLSCELFFYLLTPPLLIWAARRSTRACWVGAVSFVAAMAVVSAVVLTVFPARDQDVWVSPWFSLGDFLVGVALALTLRRRTRAWMSLRAAGVLALVTVAVMVGLSVGAPIGRTSATVLVLPAVIALIGAAATTDLRGATSWLARRWVVKLGEWSFALYLVHTIVIRVGADILKVPATSGLAAGALLIAIVAASVAAAALAYQLWERPLERWLRPARRGAHRPT